MNGSKSKTMGKRIMPLSVEQPVSPEAEGQYHHYQGNQIPWYVRVMWIGFWIFAISYTVRLLFPALTRELFPQ